MAHSCSPGTWQLVSGTAQFWQFCGHVWLHLDGVLEPSMLCFSKSYLLGPFSL